MRPSKKKIRVALIHHDGNLSSFSRIIDAFKASESLDVRTVVALDRRKRESVYGDTSIRPDVALLAPWVRDTWYGPLALYEQLSRSRVDVVIVLEEPWSTNVLFAGIISKVLFGTGVLYYSFQNLYERPSIDLLRGVGIRAFLRKALRFWLVDWGCMPLRRWCVAGGGYSYSECADVLHRFHWAERAVQCWWPVIAGARKPKVARNGKKRVGFVGRFCTEKGVEMVIRAAEICRDFEFVLMGDGPLRKELTEACKLLANMSVEGPFESSVLRAKLEELDLLVVPSYQTPTWKEQFGRVIVEAWQHEVAVVGSSSGAIPFVISDDRFVFGEGDLTSFVAAIRRGIQLGFGAQRSRANRVIEMASESVFVGKYSELAAMEVDSESVV